MPFATPAPRAVVRARPGLFVIVALLALLRAAVLSGALDEASADGHGCFPGVVAAGAQACPDLCATRIEDREDTRRPDGGTHRADVYGPVARTSHGSAHATSPLPSRAGARDVPGALPIPRTRASARASAFPATLSVVLRC